MDQDGIESFMTQLGVNAETDIVVIVIAQYMDAKFMGEFTWPEFEKGCKDLACDSVQSWTKILPRLREEFKNATKFLAIYKYAFNFAQEKGKRNVDVELACGLWDLLVGPVKCEFLQKWKTFLTGKFERNEILVVTKDTWDLFHDLV